MNRATESNIVRYATSDGQYWHTRAAAARHMAEIALANALKQADGALFVRHILDNADAVRQVLSEYQNDLAGG